jgi:hypothetical protein
VPVMVVPVLLDQSGSDVPVRGCNYDYDHVMPPQMEGMGEARISDVDMDSVMPSPLLIRLATFPASQTPKALPRLRQQISSRALAHAHAGTNEKRMRMMNGLLDMSGKVVSLVGLLMLFWVILL